MANDYSDISLSADQVLGNDFISGSLSSPALSIPNVDYSNIDLSSLSLGSALTLGDFVSGNVATVAPAPAASVSAVPYKSIIDTLGSVINAGLGVFGAVNTIQNAKAAPTPAVTYKVVSQAQPNGTNLTTGLPNSIGDILSNLLKPTVNQLGTKIGSGVNMTPFYAIAGVILIGFLIMSFRRR